VRKIRIVKHRFRSAKIVRSFGDGHPRSYIDFLTFGKIYLALVSLAGCGSAYIFGLTNLFGFGVRGFIDFQFISNSLTSVVIYFTGIIAITKLSSSFYVFTKPYTTKLGRGMATKEVGLGCGREREAVFKVWFWRRIAPFALIVLGSLLLLILLIGFTQYFLDLSSTLFLCFLFLNFFAVYFLVKHFALQSEVSRRNLFSLGWEDFNRLTIPEFSVLFRHLPLIVSALLGFSVLLGTARFHSLTNSKMLCIITDGKILRGAVVGASEDGVFWVDQPVSVWSLNFHGPQNALVNFVPKARILEVNIDCDE
tara:strand:- start:285 stop:1211 length:927 start_codon:yes stop_codon:yes gene_type:complete